MRNFKYKIFAQWAVLAALVLVLLVMVYIFVSNFVLFRSEGYIKGHIWKGRTLQINNPDQVRGWMTFRYVNLLFGLPVGFLQNALNITDKRYPNLSIATAAKEQKISSVEFLVKTTEAIKSFKQ